MKKGDVLNTKSTFNKVFLSRKLIFCFGVILLLGAGMVEIKAQGGVKSATISGL